jgi:hypothetical protein
MTSSPIASSAAMPALATPVKTPPSSGAAIRVIGTVKLNASTPSRP